MKMAESNPPSFSRLSNKHQRTTEKQAEPEELREHEIREVPINLAQTTKTDSSKQIHGCDICMAEYVFTVSLYLCYLCGEYLCEKCSKMHDKTHELVNRKHEENERSEKANNLVLGMREKFEEKGGDLDGEFVEVIGRVNVKHELDKSDCGISGLSELENKMWVAVDSDNHCIKMFCSVSNTLLRYIKFGSKPWDVTEIKIQQKSVISGATRDEPDKHCLLAVTFPDIKQIWYVDVDKTHAVKTKTIKMNNTCSRIDISEDKIFTLCSELVEFRWRYFIYILSTDGDQLKVLQIPSLSQSIDDIAAYKGRVYLSIWSNKVLCINLEDVNDISKLTLEGSSGPNGISVDPNSGVVYVCGRYRHKVYRLSPDLRDYKPLGLDIIYTQAPRKLCFMKNKLYFSHDAKPSLFNVVTVVQVLT